MIIRQTGSLSMRVKLGGSVHVNAPANLVVCGADS
jgi:hypothetical protein